MKKFACLIIKEFYEPCTVIQENVFSIWKTFKTFAYICMGKSQSPSAKFKLHKSIVLSNPDNAFTEKVCNQSPYPI